MTAVSGASCEGVVSAPVLLRLAFLGLGEFMIGVLQGESVEYVLLTRLVLLLLMGSFLHVGCGMSAPVSIGVGRWELDKVICTVVPCQLILWLPLYTRE